MSARQSDGGKQRTVRIKPYTTIPNDMLRNPDLSWGARGILAYALSHSDEWVTSREALVNASASEGKAVVQRYLNELTKAGYRRIVRWQASDGRWQSVVEWYDEPHRSPGNPDGR